MLASPCVIASLPGSYATTANIIGLTITFRTSQ
jgi:hypothetical protein